MAKRNINVKSGFTIIEVVLVLAIAGLIFLMVFIALPALQRSQRDTQRREDMSRFISQLAQYQANNNGKVPGESGTVNAAAYNTFITNYLKVGGDTFNDPSTGNTYNVTGVKVCTSSNCSTSSASNNMGDIYVLTNATCDGETPVYVQGNRKIAVRIKLEGAGIYCGHN